MRTKTIELRGALITISLVALAIVLTNFAPSIDARAGAGDAGESSAQREGRKRRQICVRQVQR